MAKWWYWKYWLQIAWDLSHTVRKYERETGIWPIINVTVQELSVYCTQTSGALFHHCSQDRSISVLSSGPSCHSVLLTSYFSYYSGCHEQSFSNYLMLNGHQTRSVASNRVCLEFQHSIQNSLIKMNRKNLLLNIEKHQIFSNGSKISTCC